VRFKPYQNLEIQIKNISIEYLTQITNTANNKVYDTSASEPKISSGFLILNLDNSNLSVPSAFGNSTITLTLGGNTIFQQKIYVASMPVINSVFPLSVAAGIDAKFTASVSSGNKSIVKYFWNFDGDEIETTANYTNYKIDTLGEHTLTLTVQDEAGLNSSKEFVILAGNPKNIANSTLSDYRKRINNITRQIENYPSWYKKKIEDNVNIVDLDSQLKSLERKFDIASSDEDYAEIMSNLSEMDVPKSIKNSAVSSFQLLLDKENINPADLETMGAGTFDSENEESYKEAVVRWYYENVKINVDYSYVYLYYENRVETILSYFKINIAPNSEKDIENYLIIGDKAVTNSENSKDLSE